MMHTQAKDFLDHPTSEVTPCVVQTSSLNEELGQVRYILTDKTGTLTENKMLFHKLVVGRNTFNDARVVEGANREDPRLVAALEDQGPLKGTLTNVMRCLTLCNNAYFDQNNSLNSTSSEELSFLRFAANYGFVCNNPEQSGNSVCHSVSERGTLQNFVMVEKFNFKSERKRMSVVVEINGEMHLFIKGADDVIKPRLKTAKDLEFLLFEVDRMAQEGHRVMMLAWKRVDRGEWKEFAGHYSGCKNKPELEERMLQMQDAFENDLELLGAVAIEDRLQDGVKESVEFIRRAGIRMWMITGDKSETGLAVARNAGLVSHNAEIVCFNEQETVSESVLTQLLRQADSQSPEESMCCLVHGTFLSEVLEQKYVKKELYRQFVQLLMKMESAVFTRTSPRQKQEIVQIIRDHDEGLVTLAIGDGANDVNMISGAHVGVGIRSREGNQAARAADVSFGEFKHLVPLLFYFGKECYRRNSAVVLFIFSKNVMIVMAQFWYGFWNFFSGQPLYEPWIYQLYNIAFTFLPIFVFGIFDKSTKKSKMLVTPEHYRPGMDNYHFSNFKILWNLLLSFAVSFYVMIASLVFFDWGNYSNGWTYGFWNFGNMCYFGVVIIVNLKVVSISKSYSVVLGLFVALGILLFVIVWFFANLSMTSVLYATFVEILSGSQFWMYLVVVLGICAFEFIVYRLEEMVSAIAYTPEISKEEVKGSVSRQKKVSFEVQPAEKHSLKSPSAANANHVSVKGPPEHVDQVQTTRNSGQGLPEKSAKGVEQEGKLTEPLSSLPRQSETDANRITRMKESSAVVPPKSGTRITRIEQPDKPSFSNSKRQDSQYKKLDNQKRTPVIDEEDDVLFEEKDRGNKIVGMDFEDDS